MNNLVHTYPYDGKPVLVELLDPERIYINATAVAKRFGKRVAHFLELPETKRYMSALAASLSVGKSDTKVELVLTRMGRGDRGSGVWLHRKLALQFARWLDAQFAVWLDDLLERVVYNLAGVMQDRQRMARLLALHDRKQQLLRETRLVNRDIRDLLMGGVAQPTLFDTLQLKGGVA